MIDLENGTAALARRAAARSSTPNTTAARAPPVSAAWLTWGAPAGGSGPRPDAAGPVGRHPRLQAGLAARACVKGEADQAPFDLAALLLGPEPFLMALMQPEQHGTWAGFWNIASNRSSATPGPGRGRCGLDRVGDSTAGPDVCSPVFTASFPRIPTRFGWLPTWPRPGCD